MPEFATLYYTVSAFAAVCAVCAAHCVAAMGGDENPACIKWPFVVN